MKRLLVLPLLLLVACATEDAQPDRPTAWNLSGELVETVGDGCIWSGGDSIDLDLIGLDTAGGTSPDDGRIACSIAVDWRGNGSSWDVTCQMSQDPTTCETDEFPFDCERATLLVHIAKFDGEGTLDWNYEDGCMFRFDVVATDL